MIVSHYLLIKDSDVCPVFSILYKVLGEPNKRQSQENERSFASSAFVVTRYELDHDNWVHSTCIFRQFVPSAYCIRTFSKEFSGRLTAWKVTGESCHPCL
jgi:hypothetical protein